MTYPPEHQPPSPDAPEVLHGLGYIRPDMHVIGPDEYEVAEPGSGRVLIGVVVAVVAALIWWGW